MQVKSTLTRSFIFLLLFPMLSSFGQVKEGNLNTLNYAVPFLTIAPDSRAGAMGDAGVATRPDINSQHWNVAKYAFMKEKSGVSISYTPWLRKIIHDINLAYLAGYYKPDDKQVISGSLRYFSLGQITFTDFEGISWGIFTPNEMAIDAGYTRLFTEHLSGGVVFRFIHSDLTKGQLEDASTAVAVAADLGVYYQRKLNLGAKSGGYALGMSLTNLGTPISYTKDGNRMPLPSNMRFGGRFDFDLDDYNKLSFNIDFNKLLVPTTPELGLDSTGQLEVVRGRETPESIVLGMFQSFYDAPGIDYDDGTWSSGFREEMAEIMISTGIEYWYRDQFAIRSGYFHEASVKGNRKYFTFGIGLQLNIFSIDFAYLIPTNGQQSPLANTLRFTLGFDFSSMKR